MALSSGQLTGLYIGLACIALIISTSLMLALTLNPMVCVGIYAFFMVGCFAFIFAYLTIKKDSLKGDIRYDVADYGSLFCMVLSVFIFIMSFVIPSIKNNKKDQRPPFAMYSP